ncbi:MAG TPA: PilT/PilU family type 4a pilus ATPase [Clostridia bacterium]|nr:PilT/PilU family type 4a pilus ATPase [Clostridia bacterium]
MGMAETEMPRPTDRFNALLTQAVSLGASDVHIVVNAPCTVRVSGELVALGTGVLTAQDTEEMLREILDDDLWARFKSRGEVDFSYSLSEVGRFRINAYRQRGSISMAIRVIPYRIPSFEELGIPTAVADLVRKQSGLILVTGPAGSGRSTTLASLVDLINREQRRLVLTIEDPIEYLHRHRRSIVNQRELGVDVASYEEALKTAMKQDPDVIFLSELPDAGTISKAIAAAESGRLVIGGMIALNTSHAIERIIDLYPSYHQEAIKTRLAEVLEGIISQRLIKSSSLKTRRVAVFEVLVGAPIVRKLIKEGRISQIPAAIEGGRQYGMMSMEASARELVRSGQISWKEYEDSIGSPNVAG